MPAEGPEIERLTRRLAECPADFLAEGTDVVAVVCDHVRIACTGEPPEASPELAKLRKASKAVQTLLPADCLSKFELTVESSPVAPFDFCEVRRRDLSRDQVKMDNRSGINASLRL